MLYSFWFPDGVAGAPDGAHAIAFFRKQDRIGRNADNLIYAYDPNSGEYVFVEGQRDRFFTYLLVFYGNVTRHWMCTLRA